MRIALILATLLALTACSGRGAGGSSPGEGRSPSLPTWIGSPKVPATPHIDRPPDDETHLTGTLGYDTIEGGCGYLRTDEQTRYEMIWPHGWSFDGTRLRDMAGTVVAKAGDTLTVRGSVQGDMASTCQIGPIFRISEVITIDR
ncbi:MAG TPA: hypothetical protein VFK56_07575 [Mycobacterium sp.]|nr:hypothetical protein [Mycobacterium sp.]